MTAPGTSERVVIYGAGDLGWSQLRIFAAAGVAVEGFVDDLRPAGESFQGLPVLGDVDEGLRLLEARPELSLAFAIGYRRFDLRAGRFDYLAARGARFASSIHPSAIVDPAARLGRGVVLFPGTVIDHGAELEDNVLVNTGAVVAHDSIVRRHAFVSPGVAIAGFVTVGSCAMVGLGARLLEHCEVGRGALVAAGAVVRDNVPDFTLVAGVPAEEKKKLEPFAIDEVTG